MSTDSYCGVTWQQCVVSTVIEQKGLLFIFKKTQEFILKICFSIAVHFSNFPSCWLQDEIL